MLVNIWPTTNVINILLLKPGSEEPDVKGTPSRGVELLQRHLRMSTYFLLAVAVWVWGYEDLIARSTPATLHTVLRLYGSVALRNMIIIHAFYGGWHWCAASGVSLLAGFSGGNLTAPANRFLYERPLSVSALTGRKFNPSNIGPSGQCDATKGYDAQSCRRWASSGVLIESIYETFMITRWAAGAAPHYTAFWSRPLWSLLWLLFVGVCLSVCATVGDTLAVL